MKQILLVDDDPKVSEAMVNFFGTDDYNFYVSKDGETALKLLPEIRPDLVLLDINLPGVSGLDVLKEIKKNNTLLPVIVITGQISAENAIDTMKQGAYEFLTKPFTLERLASLMDKALKQEKIETTIEEIVTNREEPIIGKSPEIMEIAKLIGQVAPTEASVLVLGESGTGKELIARAIVKNSLRKDKPFLSVNCAALPETLLESELFGHEKGAFTGAYYRKLGKFEQADGGTIFLDEIADMSLLTQSKVLRVLQEQTFERVGGSKTIKVNARVIAATNKSLVNCIKEGTFRIDLFYRLKVFSIYLPPLRERKSDIPLLVDYFIKKYAALNDKNINSISEEALKLLKKYHWPGNVRELENNVHTAVVMAKGSVLLPEQFPIFSDENKFEIDFNKIKDDYYKVFSQVLTPLFQKVVSNSEGKIYDHLLSAFERSLIESTLKYCQDNQVKSSQILGISRNTLRDRMKKFGILE